MAQFSVGGNKQSSLTAIRKSLNFIGLSPPAKYFLKNPAGYLDD